MRKALGLLAVLALGAALAAPAAAAVFEPRDFASPAEERRYMALVSELRCLVCQNQSISESNADLAADLRRIVYEMIRDGATDSAIADHMVQRYGDFVLYRPPLKPATVLLWIGPFVLLAGGLAALALELRRRRRRAVGAPGALTDEAAHGRLADVLGDPPDDATR